MVCLEKPRPSVTSMTGEREAGFKDQQNTSALYAYTKTLSLCLHTPPPTLMAPHEEKRSEIRYRMREGKIALIISSLPIPSPSPSCPPCLSSCGCWREIRMAAAVPSATTPLIPLLPGWEKTAAREPAIREQCSQPNSCRVPVTQIWQFLPPPFNLGFPQGRVQMCDR